MSRIALLYRGHDELYVVAIYAAAVVFTYFRYILNVIEEICEHLQIHVSRFSSLTVIVVC